MKKSRGLKLSLYGQYERDEALEVLHLPKRPVYLGGALYTDGTASAWFATVSRNANASHFRRADEFEWRMKPGARLRRPPDTALSDIALLCKLEEDDQFTYVGQTKIHPAAWLREATLVLNPALDEKAWRRLGIGQYRGWQITANGKSIYVSDARERQRVIESLDKLPFCELSLNRPQGDWVYCLLEEARGYVSIQPDELGWIAVEKGRKGPAKGTVAFRLENGEVDDIALGRTVKRETAIAVVDQLLAGEERPDIVRWRRP